MSISFSAKWVVKSRLINICPTPSKMGDLKSVTCSTPSTSSGFKPALVARVMASPNPSNWLATTRLPTNFIDDPMAVPPM